MYNSIPGKVASARTIQIIVAFAPKCLLCCRTGPQIRAIAEATERYKQTIAPASFSSYAELYPVHN